MQLRSADEGSTIFYKVRFFCLASKGKEKGEVGGRELNVDLFHSVSTVEIKHPPTTSVFFPYSRLGKGPGLPDLPDLPYFLEMTCKCQDYSFFFFFFHVIIHASIPHPYTKKKSLEVLPCPLPPLGQIPHPFKPRSQPFFRLAIRLHMPRSKHFKHALRQFAFPNEFTLVIR